MWLQCKAKLRYLSQRTDFLQTINISENDLDESEAENHLSAGSAAKKVGRGKQRFCQNQWYRWKHFYTFREIKISSMSKLDCISFATFAHFQLWFRIKLWSCQGTLNSCQKEGLKGLEHHRKFCYFISREGSQWSQGHYNDCRLKVAFVCSFFVNFLLLFLFTFFFLPLGPFVENNEQILMMTML